MAIAFDSKGTGGDSTALGSTITWTHTIVSGAQGILLASLGGLGTSDVASLKFASTALTKIIHGNNGATVANDLWYLLNPPVGLGTFNGTWTATNGGDRAAVSMAYINVHQGAPLVGSTAGSISAATSGSIVNTTMAPANLFVGGITLNLTPGTTSTSTERGTANVSTLIQTTGVDSTGGTLRWTFGASTGVMGGVELLAGTVNPRLMPQGMGA